MADSDKNILIIDGSSYLFRAYHALPALTSPEGEHTGATYGIINMMRKVLKHSHYERTVMVFDPKGKTTRHHYYPDYKANRDAMPEDLQGQIKPIHDMIEALGVPIVVVPGIEADDVIGTLAKRAKEEGYQVVISTGDKDMAQLVDAQVSLINTMTDTALNEAGVLEKFGVRPDQIIDYLALMGDTSDHIPGVPKVGPKTAAKWINQYGTMAKLIDDVAAIKGKVGESLRAHLDQLPMSQRLVTIDCEIDLPVGLGDCVSREPNHTLLAEHCQRFGFKRWLQDYQHASGPSQQDVSYDCILSKAEFSRWLRHLHNAPYFALDTETDGLDAHQANLVGLSFAVASGKAAYVPFAHDYEGAPEQLDRDWVLGQLRPLLGDPERLVVGQNIKFDLNVLAHHGLIVMAKLRDTMLASYVINAGQGPHGMDHMASKYLGVETISFADVAGSGKSQLTFNQVPLDKATPYAAQDADITWQLDHVLYPKIMQEDDFDTVFHAIEMPLLPTLAMIEQTGACIAPKLLQAQSKELAATLEKLSDQIHTLGGKTFNIDSPKQLREVMYEHMKLPVLKKTPKGEPSTAEAVLKDLARDHDIAQCILQYRSLNKLRSTYTDRLPEQANPKTHRVHTSYNQAVTVTGRLSSTQPNLQNIPVRTAEGRRIRQAFVPQKDWQMMAADYSQIELRIMAHLSEDKNLLEAFANGEDIHQATAAQIYQVELDAVSSDQRRHAKAVNFGLIYGMSSFGLSKQIGSTRDEAQQMMDSYFAKYPGVLAYMDGVRHLAREQGYVETLFGRRMLLPDINAKKVALQKASERAAINAPMQGTAADIIKIAMVRVAEWLADNDYKSRMIMQVHDELVLEVAPDEFDHVHDEVPKLMCGAAELLVPLEVGVGVGKNWDEAH